MSTALKEIENKYGVQAAADVERLIEQAFRENVSPKLAALQSSITQLLSVFRTGEMLPAADLQKKSYRKIQDMLREQGKILLLYKSSPSAAVFDLRKLAELEEEISAAIATYHWAENEGEGKSLDEFWHAMEQSSPRE